METQMRRETQRLAQQPRMQRQRSDVIVKHVLGRSFTELTLELRLIGLDLVSVRPGRPKIINSQGEESSCSMKESSF